MAQPNVTASPDPVRRRRFGNFGDWRGRYTHWRTGNAQLGYASAGGSFLATFVLVLGGCSVMTVAHPSVAGVGIYSGISIALAFGLSLFAGMLVGGPGSQANPAETLGKSLRGHQPRRMLLHIPAQLLGAIVAALLVLAMYGYPAIEYPMLGAAVPNPSADWLLILIVELVGTFLLVRVGTALQGAGIISPVTIAAASGAMLTVGVFFALMVTGGSFNPARSFGPAFIASMGPADAGQAFSYFWAYYIGQFAGGWLGSGSRPRKI